MKSSFQDDETCFQNEKFFQSDSRVFVSFPHFSILPSRTFTSVEALEAAYLDGSLHPGDLKPALASALNTLIEPVRNHFKTNEDAKKLLATIKKYQQQDAAKKAASSAAAPHVAPPTE